MTTREKALDRAAKLQAQMEGEQRLGNSEAAESFAAAMQRLMLEHELNEHEVEATRTAGAKVAEEPIVERLVNLVKAGIEPRHARSANLELLAGIVGRAHLCRILIRPRSNDIIFVGTGRHAEVAEFMLATLHRALRKIAKDAYEVHYHANGGDTLVTRGFISAFKRAFLIRLEERYLAERSRVVAEHDETRVAQGETCVALIRINSAMTRVEAYLEARFAGRRRGAAGAVHGSRRRNEAGAARGREAADGIALRANGVASGATRKQIGA